MIKYIQKLKARKGFTLVELIVVIAIIGVLAAILIPVMLGYVTDSRISSVDSTASSLKDTLNTFITDMDAKNAGVKRTATAILCELSVARGETDELDGITFTVGGDEGVDALLTSAAKKWGGSDDGSAWIDAFRKKINDDYNFKDATAQLWVKNGMCIGVAYYAGTIGEGDTFTWPTATSFEKGKIENYWGDKEGIISASGELLGTNPKLTKSA